MSAINKIYPAGYTTLHMALSRLSEAISIDLLISKGHHLTADASSSDIIEANMDFMREALFHGAIIAHHYYDDLLEVIPAGAWRNREAELWIQDGERLSRTGRTETIFIEEENLTEFIRTLNSSIDVSSSNSRYAFLSGKIFYVSPFMALMIEAILKFDIPNKPVKKETLVEYFEKQSLPNGRPVSKNHALNMATFCRPAELMKGGLKAAHRRAEGFNP